MKNLTMFGIIWIKNEEFIMWIVWRKRNNFVLQQVRWPVHKVDIVTWDTLVGYGMLDWQEHNDIF